MGKIKKYTIFGERNSGTIYLSKLLAEMLYIEFTQDYGHKYWFIKDLNPRGIANTTTDNECIKSLDDNSNTLFIIIVKNPYDWVGSMFEKPIHMKDTNNKSIYDFMTEEYISYENKCPMGLRGQLWLENKESKFPYFIEQADNLIELRNLKLTHLANLKNKVTHYCVIREEKLLKDVNNMVKKYNIKHKTTNLPEYIKPKNYMLNSKTINYIKNNLNNSIDSKYYT